MNKLYCFFVVLWFLNFTNNWQSFAQDSSNKQNVFSFALRVGFGMQHTGFAEAGVSLWSVNSKKFGNATLVYSTVECSPNVGGVNPKTIWALKAGFETYASLFALGCELKQLTNFESNTIVLTPKLGVGALGAMGFFLGYNFRDEANYFTSIGKWQFSMNVNLNKKVASEIFKKRKPLY